MLDDKEGPQVSINSRSKQKIYKLLDEMEAEWSKKQKEISKKRVAQSFEKRKRSTEVVNILLRKCKEHNGPFTSVEELQAFVSSSNPKEIKKLLRVEMQLKKITNKEDSADRPELYK